MGASFRTKDQIIAVAGCDLVTISPALLKELSQSTDQVVRILDAEKSKTMDIPKLDTSEKSFRYDGFHDVES